VLVLDYLQTTGQTNPEVELMAEKYVATGYQRLLTFEVPGGGYSLFGRPPAQVFLTAYGLMEFTDMAKVYPVDQDMIDRTARWLLDQQQPDGTWLERGYSEHWRVEAELPTTAYITWALIEAGYKNSSEVNRAIAYIREFARQEEDAYGLALIANALSAYDPNDSSTRAILEKLYNIRIEEDETVYWQNSQASFMGATGSSGSVETTALAASAFMRAAVYPDAVSGALASLIQSKDSWGTWQTTQATILSLKTLLLATQSTGAASEAATVRVSLNKELSQEINIDPSQADVVHLVTFDRGFSPTGANRLQLEVEGGGNLMYQVATSYYLPWDKVTPVPETVELIDIDLAYDRTRLAVNDTVTVDVGVKLNQEGIVKMALIDLGVPPGFTVLTEDLSRLVEQGLIARYELTGRQIIIYLEDFSSDQPLKFSYRLRARFPMRAQTPPSSVYDYYNPTGQTTKAPLEIEVEDEG
jgi:uncharacterized protein YfaS (alpha-2-macroglobulin family)